MTNAELRREAWRLFKKYYRTIGAAIFAVGLVMQLPVVIEAFMPASMKLAPWVSTAWGIVTGPFTAVGVVWYAYGILAGGAPDRSRLTAFVRSPGLFIRALALGAINTLVINLPTQLAGYLSADIPAEFGLVFGLLTIAVSVFALFAYFRLSAAPLIFARDGQHRPLRAMAESWRITRGSVSRILGMVFATGWPIMAALVVYAVVVTGVGAGASAHLRWLQAAILPVLSFLWMGYYYLSATNLSRELMDRPLPPKQTPRIIR